MLLLYVQEPDLEVLANMLEAIQDTVRLVGPALMTLEQLGQAFERFRSVLDDSAKRRRERVDITTGEDFDDEEAEALEVSPAVVDVRNPLHPESTSAALVQVWLGRMLSMLAVNCPLILSHDWEHVLMLLDNHNIGCECGPGLK